MDARLTVTHPGAPFQQRLVRTFAPFKHLVDGIKYGTGLIKYALHTQKTSIHTCLHAGSPEFSDYTLPLPHWGTVTRARACDAALVPEFANSVIMS